MSDQPENNSHEEDERSRPVETAEPVILPWCQRVSGGILDDYLADGGFAGADRAAELETAGVISMLRASGLREWDHDGRLVHRSWMKLIQSPGDKVLVVDAREADPRSLITSTLLGDNPFGLVEGLFIASMTTGAGWVRLLLSHGHEYLLPALRMAINQACAAHLIPGCELELEDENVSVTGPRKDEPTAVHSLQTWYQIPLLLRHGPEWFAALGRNGLSGRRLLTIGGNQCQPRLLEAPAGTPLSDALVGLIDPAHASGSEILTWDGGLGGFMSLPQLDTPLAPEEMALAGVNPASSTLWALGPDHCVVDLVRRSLIEIVSSGMGDNEVFHQLTLNALRLVTKISLRRGEQALVGQLGVLADKLVSLGSPAGWPLKSSLMHFGPEWTIHVNNLSCVAFDTLAPLQPPCQSGCPAGIDIPAFVALAGLGRFREAVEVIRRDNPLPYICGLVCPAPCEDGCLRGVMDTSISIRAIKAVAAKHCLEEGGYPLPQMAPDSGRRTAVIGAGPAGLSAAYFLTIRGHRVEVFEEHEVVGGTMRLGIPDYRLPPEVIDAEAEAIAAMGVTIHTGAKLGRDFTLQGLRDDGFDAVFMGIGARCGYVLNLEGEDQFGPVLDSITFLREVALGDHQRPADKVVVVGGGNAAMDAARTCVRLGCDQVTIAYRRTRGEMPAHEEEIEAALAEGVKIEFLSMPLKVVGQGGRVTGLECLKAKLGEPDASGRRSPVPIEGSETVLEAGAVIVAIGQEPDLACLGSWSQDEGICRSKILADPMTGQTKEKWLFAGGDAVTGPRTVVEAVAAGKQVARAMDAYLRGQMVELTIEYPRAPELVQPVGGTIKERSNLPRSRMPELPVAERIRSFEEVELGLTDQMVLNEAKRCLRCDLCIGCGLCEAACQEIGARAIRLRATKETRRVFCDFERTAERCVGCGSCANSCPTGAMQMVDQDGMRRTMFTGTVIQELELIPCSLCGRPFASQSYLDQLDSRMARPSRPEAQRYICPTCVRQMRASNLLRRSG